MMGARFWVDHNGKCPDREQTLTDFLLARIKEDEHSGLFRGHSEALLARVLAEADAKRRIVERHRHPHPCRESLVTVSREPGVAVEIEIRWPCEVLQLLALPYAEHPDYAESWRP